MDPDFRISPQPIYIYDKENDKQLVLDGVIKVEHTVSLKIEDDTDNIKSGKGYVNNARQEANEVVIEGMMSSVYTSRNDLAGEKGDRLKNAFTYLEEIKSSRRLVEVVTTLLTYKRMLVKQVQVLQDETNPFGYSVAITLHEQIESHKKPTDNTSTTKPDQTVGSVDSGPGGGRTPSVWYTWVGGNAL